MRPAAVLLATVALTALAAVASAAKPPPLPGALNPDLAGRAADYGALSQLVATVLLVREGGVDKALDAVPLLHDETHAYVRATALLAANPSWGNISDWKGLTAKQHTLLAKNLTGNPKQKNLTAFDPLVGWGDQLQKKLNASGKLGWDPAADPKANKTTTFLDELGDKIVGNDAAWIDSLNTKLKQYNIVVTGKSVAQPSKFSNAAATIARSITGLSLAAFGVKFAPCLVSWSNTGLLAGVTGINIQPEGLAISNKAVVIGPTAVNLQPGLILINPVGYSVQPQGFQVAPFLIAVAPVGSNVQPQGFNVAPNDIAIVPTGKAISPGGYSNSPVGVAWAPTDIDLTPPKNVGAPDGVPIAGKRRLLGAGPDGEGHPIEIMEDPLDLSNEMPHDYRNWAAVLSQVLLQKENDAEEAANTLGRVMLDVHGHLSALADGEAFAPRFHLNDPNFLGSLVDEKNIGAPPVSATKYATSGSFIRFAPCVLSESTTGADISAVGLNIIPRLISIRNGLADVGAAFFNLQPQLIFIGNTGLSVSPQGLSVQPGLLYFGAIGANVQPQGGNIQPQLITVAPVGSNVQPQGANFAPVRKLIAPTHIGYAPKKKSVGGTAIDLTDPKTLAEMGGSAPPKEG